MGAVSFIETMDHSSLSNITADEFELCVFTFAVNLFPYAVNRVCRNVETAAFPRPRPRSWRPAIMMSISPVQ